MRIAVIGTGYVGLTTGACIANLGNRVICVDRDKRKVSRLRKGEMTFFEPGLRDVVERNRKEHRLEFSTDTGDAVRKSEVIFIAVGTPSREDGSADISQVLSAAAEIGRHMNGYKVVVDKSTVPVGTADKVQEAIRRNQKKRHEFDLVSNPEFLREGQAVHDFTIPDRIVIGVDNGRAREVMLQLYKPIERTGKPILFTDVKSAELIKYASNAMLAARISFMNELSRLCERVGADIKIVAKGMGLDSRIGPRFLQAGIGYGGSCFRKDILSLIHTMGENGVESGLLEAVDRVNEEQKVLVARKVEGLIRTLKGKRIAVWGLAFKPNTDDMRDAPSLVLIRWLVKRGASVSAFDPVAMDSARQMFAGVRKVSFSKSAFDAARDADCLVVVTEWDEFREVEMKKLRKLMKSAAIVDGRNIYEPEEMRKAGFRYAGVGR